MMISGNLVNKDITIILVGFCTQWNLAAVEPVHCRRAGTYHHAVIKANIVLIKFIKKI